MASFPEYSPQISPTPTFAWLKERVWRLFAFGFGSGLSKVAPGTIGTLWAWIAALTYHLYYPNLSTTEGWILLLAGFIFGTWICGLTGAELGKPDHGGMVWDEMLAFWLILFFLPTTWIVQLIAFVLFRFFDIVKPQPIAMIDQYFKTWQPSALLQPYKNWIRGFGVMIDDILAALATLIVISILIRTGFIIL